MNKKVLVPIANGTEELEAVGIIDTLRRASGTVLEFSFQQLKSFNEKLLLIEVHSFFFKSA
jgi:putative intracellular protease/amidase